jgi:hypothetical protein
VGNHEAGGGAGTAAAEGPSWQWSGGANVVTLRWTNNGSFCVLESTASLTGDWNMVPVPFTTNANWFSAVVTNAVSAQFYRLKGN